MAYRNGTYVAFDGLGTTSPILGDIKYFNLLKGWKVNNSADFIFSDSHKKTNQVRDYATMNYLKSVLRTRFSHSKNMIIILTDNTRPDRELLNYEIKKAIELGLPIIVCYASVQQPIHRTTFLEGYWPHELRVGIENNTAKCIHIPFKKPPIFDAVAQFSVNKKNDLHALTVYSQSAYTEFGL